MAGESTTGVAWLDQAMQPKYDAQELALRDLFVAEYLKDYDAFAAAIRCGFAGSFAKTWAQTFMDETYVRCEIKRLELAAVTKHTTELNKRKILSALMREAQQFGGSQAARVSALTTLAKIHGMDAPPSRAGANGTASQRGVMVVPGIAKALEWEQAAVASQSQLVNATRS